MTDHTARIPILEEIIEQLSGDMDGADLFMVLLIVADSRGENFDDFIHTRLAQDLIDITQSNPTMAMNRLRRLARLDKTICEYDAEESNNA